MSNSQDLLDSWAAVPVLVRGMLPAAKHIQTHHIKAASDLGLLSNTAATWVPDQNALFVYSNVDIPENLQMQYKMAVFKKISPKAYFVSHNAVPNWEREVLLKRGAFFPAVGQAWDYANNALGGSRPLSNAIVSSLALGGLGYGAGTLMEHLFPERYVERGKLRKTLGLAGVLGGVGIGANNAYANARATGTTFGRGWLVPNNALPKDLAVKTGAFEGDNDISGLMTPSIPVDAFNRVVWNDVRKGVVGNQYNPYGTKSPWGSNEQPMHTPPQLASATTGLMSGISQMAGSPVLRPADVIHGIASAGVGLATAHLAGKTLSALAGLTPEAQNKLQDMGLWAGMLHAVVPPLFSQMR